MRRSADEQAVRDAISQWDRAMVLNDADDIGRHMLDDWQIVGADGSVETKEGFLSHVRSGELTHDLMETHMPTIRLFGNVALVLATGWSGGRFRGEPFKLHERMSCVFVRHDDQWRCALTHLSALPEA